MRLLACLAATLATLGVACASSPPRSCRSVTSPGVPQAVVQRTVTPPTVTLPIRAPQTPAPRTPGDEIVICGARVHTGTPVVLWSEPPGYDAYATAPRFAPRTGRPAESGPRYQPGRVEKRSRPNPAYVPEPPAGSPDARTAAQKLATIPDVPRVLVAPEGDERGRLAQVVDQFVLHFDACGLSRTCFGVLQDERHLSVHFLLDVDGTIYQTLDLRETAWHATKSNSRSIGIEIANVGAYPPGSTSTLDAWYAHDAFGPYIRVPAHVEESGVRRPGFVGRPARDALVRGRVQGDELVQYDFTPEQYDALGRLTAVLCRELPRIRPDAPRDADGRVRDAVLPDDEWARFEGILGHFHVQKNKRDPGPAFDWERFLSAVRARMKEGSPP